MFIEALLLPTLPTDTYSYDTLSHTPLQVLHPHIYTRVSRDLAILSRVAQVCEVLMPSLVWLGLKESVYEFAELMMRQVNTRIHTHTRTCTHTHTYTHTHTRTLYKHTHAHTHTHTHCINTHTYTHTHTA